MNINPSSTIRIASYNIRKAIGLDWKRDSSRILDVFSEMDADIIAVQEADRRFGIRQGTLPIDELANTLGYQFADVADQDASHGWHGNAILFRQTIKLLHSERVPIPTFEPRGAVAAVFCQSDSHPFRLIGTHLSLVGRMRRKQLGTLQQYIEQADDRYPALIAGDFNEWKKRGIACRSVGWGFEVATPGPSFHSTNPYFTLDRFVLWGGIQMQTCAVHQTETSKQASDHLPIYMDMKLGRL